MRHTFTPWLPAAVAVLGTCSALAQPRHDLRDICGDCRAEKFATCGGFRVFYLPPGDNAALTLVADGFAFPNGIALTPDGNNVIVGDFAAKRLLSIPAVGSANAFDIPHVIAHTEGGIGPDGFALDADGNIYAAIFQGREVRVIGADRFPYGSIVLPEDAGTFVTNVAFHDGWLYITEASQGVVWRVAVRRPGLALFRQR